MTAQLILYKYFWSMKHNIPLKDIRCGFILLKRGVKPGKICSLVPVSVGDKTLERGVKLMKNMISGVRKEFFLKSYLTQRNKKRNVKIPFCRQRKVERGANVPPLRWSLPRPLTISFLRYHVTRKSLILFHHPPRVRGARGLGGSREEGV